MSFDGISEIVRRLAGETEMAPSHFNAVIQVERKSHYGNEPLTYVVSDHAQAIQTLTGKKTINADHIKALKALGFIFHERTAPKAVFAGEANA